MRCDMRKGHLEEFSCPIHDMRCFDQVSIQTRWEGLDSGSIQYHRSTHATPKIWTSLSDFFSASRISDSENCSGARHRQFPCIQGHAQSTYLLRTFCCERQVQSILIRNVFFFVPERIAALWLARFREGRSKLHLRVVITRCLLYRVKRKNSVRALSTLLYG